MTETYSVNYATRSTTQGMEIDRGNTEGFHPELQKVAYAWQGGGRQPRTGCDGASTSCTPHSCQGAEILCPFRAISKGIKPSFFASRVALLFVLSNAREQPPHAQPRVIIHHLVLARRAPTRQRSRGAFAP
jgi:hypothetical protein